MSKVSGRMQWAALAAAIVASIGSTGCVERRYTIRTEPPGALVVVNNEEIGTTPVSKSYVFYGDRDITVIADGYQTQRIIQPIDAPWWDNQFTEFFTENLIPATLRDEREFQYKLEPAVNPSEGELVGRAEELRSRAQATPPPRRGGFLGFFGF